MFDWSLDPTVTFASWAIIIGSFFQNVSSYGADQITIQRYLTSRSIDESRRAYSFCAWATLPMNLLFVLVGLGIYVYYRQHPGTVVSLATPDYIVPYFAVHEMPAGFAGLVIASIFSLSLTTHSSGLHSVNTAVMNDFVVRLGLRGKDPRSQVRAARIGTLVWGALTTVLAFYISNLGVIAIATKKINLFFGGVLLGIFLLGMLTRRVGSAGALLGALTGITTVALVGQFTAVSFFWYGPLGCLVTLIAGSLFGQFFPKPAEERVRGLRSRARRNFRPGAGPAFGPERMKPARRSRNRSPGVRVTRCHPGVDLAGALEEIEYFGPVRRPVETASSRYFAHETRDPITQESRIARGSNGPAGHLDVDRAGMDQEKLRRRSRAEYRIGDVHDQSMGRTIGARGHPGAAVEPDRASPMPQAAYQRVRRSWPRRRHWPRPRPA